MNDPRPSRFVVRQYRNQYGATFVVRVIQARTRAEAIAIFCRRTKLGTILTHQKEAL